MKNKVILSLMVLSISVLLCGTAQAVPVDFRLTTEGGHVISSVGGDPAYVDPLDQYKGIVEATQWGDWRAGFFLENAFGDLTGHFLAGNIGTDAGTYGTTADPVFGVGLLAPGETYVSYDFSVVPGTSGGTDFLIDFGADFSGVDLTAVDTIGIYVVDPQINPPWFQPTTFTLSNVRVVPEPSSIMLLTAGIGGLFVVSRGRKRK